MWEIHLVGKQKQSFLIRPNLVPDPPLFVVFNLKTQKEHHNEALGRCYRRLTTEMQPVGATVPRLYRAVNHFYAVASTIQVSYSFVPLL